MREQIQFSQRAQSFKHARFLQERVTRAMDKLQCLDDELDFTDSAAPKLYVASKLFRSNHVAFDAMLDVRYLIEQIWRCTPWVDEWLMQTQKIVSQLATAGDSACFDKSNPFPRFAEASIVVFHAFKRS